LAARFSSIAAWAAARRATGTRYGEQLDVGQADAVAELHGIRVAAVLAADAELDARTGLALPFSMPRSGRAGRRRSGRCVANGFFFTISFSV
jgi:hypothetical protein